MIELKNATESPTEHAAIARLLIQCYVDAGFVDPAHAPQLIDPARIYGRGEVILAMSNQALAGMVICVHPGSSAKQVAQAHEAEVHLLAVDPVFRNHGLGARLMKACEDRAVERGFRDLVLSTQTTMTHAHRLYERLGYRRNPSRDWSRADGRKFLVYEKGIS